MKKLFILPLVVLSLIGMTQVKKQKKVILLDDSATTSKTKYKDNIDDRMKGPNGEKVYIGPNGGRYYLKGTKKVYVPIKMNKKKAA